MQEKISLTNIEKILEGLSPEKRLLLEKKLKEDGSKFGVFPLSYAQQRLWFLEQLQPGNTAYNIPTAIKLTGNLNLDALEKSLLQIVKRHEVLRTYIYTIDETPMQIVEKQVDVTIHKINLVKKGKITQKDEIKKILNEEITKPFNLSTLPLFRVTLVKLSNDEYILILLMHHIISDGWSAGIFITELSRLYSVNSKGETFDLPPLEIQYADFAKWQKKWLTGELKEKQLHYWKEQLNNIPVLELPTDFSRPKQQSLKGAVVKGEIEKELTEKFTKFSKRNGLTLFMSLFAAFNVLLYKYSGHDDFAVGTPIANRNKKQIENLIGFFVNTLALRANIKPDISFVQYLTKYKETILSAFANQDLPLEMIIEELQLERDMSHTPIFQVMFAFQNKSNTELKLEDIKLSQLEFDSVMTKFDITFIVSETQAGKLALTFEYNTLLYKQTTIERMIEHYKQILKQVTANEKLKLSDITLITEAEKKKIFEEFNVQDKKYKVEKPIHEIFAEKAKAYPDKIAIKFKEKEYTYKELNTASDKLAVYISSRAKTEEKLIGIYMERGADLIIGIIGILKSGYGYLPMDPVYPNDRIEFMLEDANVNIVITEENLQANLPKKTLEKILIKDSIISEEENIVGKLKAVKPSSLAYCIYTSGSTGKPKGTLITHYSVIRLLNSTEQWFEFNEKDVWTLFHSHAFDFSVWEIFGSLLYGGKLVIVPYLTSRNPKEFYNILIEEKITVLNQTPSAFRQLLAIDEEERVKTVSLRYIIFGGEALDLQILKGWVERHGENKPALINMYGITETTVHVTYRRIKKDDIEENRGSIIGRAIDDLQVYVMDDSKNILPIGIPGEIYVGGEGLANGYLNRKELTKERFTDNPYGKGRLYKSGDLARYLDNGDLEYLGRVDNQVKIRGFRIELGEIKNLLASHNNIKEVEIILYTQKNNDKIIVAYIVPHKKNNFDTNEVKNYLTCFVPDYMLPSRFILIGKFPLTPNGKVDIRALPEPGKTIDGKERIIVEPITKTENILLAFIRDLLQLNNVSTTDNFFLIGGHSLLATQLLIRLKKKFSVDIPLKYIFEKPIIKDFAKVIEEHLDKNARSKSVSIPKIQRNRTLQLSYQQQRLWFLDQLDPMNSSYNIPVAIKIKGKLHLPFVEETVNRIIFRHEILRSYIATENGKPEIKLIDDYKYKIEHQKIQKNKIDKLSKEYFSKPFKLDEYQLFRIKIFEMNKNEYILLFVIHHILSDGWSSGIFIKEFASIYSALNKKIEPELMPLETQYIDFSNWQRDYLEKTVFAKQLEFWKSNLFAIPSMLQLSTDKPRPIVQTFKGSAKRFRLSDNLSKKIRSLSEKENVTPFMVLIAAFNLVLSKYSHQNDICIGTPVANRNHSAIENLIGFFVNTIVIRLKLIEEQKTSEYLKEVKNISLKAFSNQDIPFEKIVDSLDIERSVTHSPVFQVMFTFQNVPQHKVELSELEIEAVEPEPEISKFDMSLTMTEMENSIFGGTWEFNTDLFLPATIERMIKHFENVLKEFVNDTEKQIGQIKIMTEEEQTLLLNDWNDTLTKSGTEITLHQKFSEAVNKFASNIAVSINDKNITYKELDLKSNKLANYLIGRKVAVDSLVGFYLERSIESIVSIIAIWKVGAAYVPLDPSYPEERINYMIEDSGISNVIVADKDKEIFQNGKVNTIILQDILNDESISDAQPDIKSTPDNLAYIIYTSGSTGKPKGVMIRQKSVLNLANELAEKFYGNSKELNVSLNAPLAFDASVQELVALFYGHTLFIIPQEIRLDGEGLMNFITENKLDVFDCVPTQLKILLEQGFNENTQYRPAYILPGGEPIDNETWNMLANIKDVIFFNMYGPTECTVDSTICKIESDFKKPSIGRPINNVTHYVLDDKLNLLPIGVAGQLYIGGKGVARGYLKKPQLTAEKFIPNPFAKLKGERIYKTGDLVRYLPDGNIEYIARIDTQVKLRGFRIELGEIETVLKTHEDIDWTVVIIREDRPNVKKLVAYFTTINKNLKNEELKKHLSETLPEYMIPNFFVKLDQIPLTPNGKINNKSLPEPEIENTVVQNEFISPRTEKEIILAEVWKEVLGFDKIGTNDNFFRLGGDSIVAIQMIAKAKQNGLQITPVQIFQNQTLQSLALVAKEIEIVNAEQGLVKGIFPLTPIQEYFFEQNYVISNHWNQSVFLKINDKLDNEKLEQAVKHLLLHHDELRAKFSKIKGKWQQEVSEKIEENPFEIVDLSSFVKDSLQQKIEELNNNYQKSLDIEKGKIIKVISYKIDEKDFRILIVIHHLVIDGVSWRIIVEDLIALYNLLLANKKIILPAKTTSFKEWSQFINDYAISEELDREKKFWLTLSKKQIPAIEKDFTSNNNLEDSSFTKSLTIDAERTSYLLKDIHETYNTQINDILLSALFIAYNKWKGKRKLLVHMEGHGREELTSKHDVSGTIGWFTSLFPISLDMAEAVEIGSIVKLVKENLRSIPNRGIGFGILRYLSNDIELQSKLKIFDDVQLMFNYLGQFDQTVPENTPFTIAEENKGADRGLKNKRISLIDVTAAVSQGVMSINISASKNQFKQESIKQLLENIKDALQNIINNCKGNNKVEYTSSDFDLIDLEDDQLSSVLNKLNNEDD